MDTRFLKEHAKEIEASEAKLKEPMSQEDYKFERACEYMIGRS